MKNISSVSLRRDRRKDTHELTVHVQVDLESSACGGGRVYMSRFKSILGTRRSLLGLACKYGLHEIKRITAKMTKVKQLLVSHLLQIVCLMY